MTANLDIEVAAPAGPSTPGPRHGVPALRALRALSLDTAVPVGLFLSVFAYSIVLSRSGPLLTPDSASYLGAAHNLLHGRGLTTPAQADTSTLHLVQAAGDWDRQPYVEFGPLYPLLMAGVSLLGFALTDAARIVNAGAIALLSLSGFLIARRLQAGRHGVPLVVGLLLAFAPARTEPGLPTLNPMRLSTFALSEPITLGLAALSLYLYLRFIQDGSGRVLDASLLMAGLAAAARFQLLSLVLAELLIAVFVIDSPLRRRTVVLLRAAASGAAPLVLLQLFDTLVFHEQTGEQIRHHGSSATMPDLLKWLFGGLIGSSAAVLLTLLTLGACAAVLLTERTAARRLLTDRVVVWWAAVLTVFVVTQVGFLWFTRTWLNAYLTIDQRMLSSSQQGLYLLVVTLACVSLTVLRIGAARTRLAPAYPAVWTLVAAGVLAAGVHSTSRRFVQPMGWPEAPVLGAEPGSVIVTNDPPDVYLETGRPSLLAPVDYFMTVAEANGQLPDDLAGMARLLRECGGEVVMVPELSSNVPARRVLQVARRYGQERRFPDGVVIVSVPPPRGVVGDRCEARFADQHPTLASG